MELNAKWIWKYRKEYNTYNDSIIARKIVVLSAFKDAVVRITADSFYRLEINNHWVNDGPARGWPEHYKYDTIDVSPYLHEGKNSIEIIARYYGSGDFHRVCKQAGLLAQFDINLVEGGRKVVVTDSSWEVSELFSLIRNTPKISIQQDPYEYYDARLKDNGNFEMAVELFGANDCPWKDLSEREVRLLSKEPISFKRFRCASVVEHKGENYCFPAVRLLFPGVIEVQSYIGAACGFASIIRVRKKCRIKAWSRTLMISIGGITRGDNQYFLEPGKHLLLAFIKQLPEKYQQESHEKEKNIRIVCDGEYALENLYDAAYENPWVFVNLNKFTFLHNDLEWNWTVKNHPELEKKIRGYTAVINKVFNEVTDEKSFRKLLGKYAQCLPLEEMLLKDPFWKFFERIVLEDGAQYIENQDALMHNNDEWTQVQPCDRGDIELCYDLGEQRIGYYEIELFAEDGVEVQISGIEYITKNGELQHTNMITTSLNGMTYITKEGYNRYLSLKRRSGRYIFITFRNQKKPIRIRLVRIVESTYPVDYRGSFACSDIRLDRIWEISARTLKLCMEDTFTDCPLYEQTLWVGDARNEALFTYPVFGVTDISRSCIDIAGQSLDRYPIIGCQVPSAWDTLIPIWSFLWIISIWDYYWYTGDINFIKERYGLIIDNLKGAKRYIESDGLFSATMWNFFDWSGIDQDQKKVLHNSFFLVGAVDAALRCANVIEDYEHNEWLGAMRKELVNGLNSLWDDGKRSYPDSVHDNGSISTKICHHTSFLSILYNVADKDNIEQVKANTTTPLKEMTKVGSPFAILYLFEALEKIGAEDIIIESIYSNYLPMLKAGATTVWEIFPNSPWAPDGTKFPTRSHCHAWSSAPAYFLNRIILGIKQSVPGGKSFTISPRLSGLNWAHGRVASIMGIIDVRWELDDENLYITIKHPDFVKFDFVRNDSMEGLNVFVNGVKERNH